MNDREEDMHRPFVQTRLSGSSRPTTGMLNRQRQGPTYTESLRKSTRASPEDKKDLDCTCSGETSQGNGSQGSKL